MCAGAMESKVTAGSHGGFFNKDRKSTEGAESGARSSPGYFAKKDLRKCRRSGTAILAEDRDRHRVLNRSRLP